MGARPEAGRWDWLIRKPKPCFRTDAAGNDPTGPFKVDKREFGIDRP